MFLEKTMSLALKGSKTEKNLLKAFAGESQARNRYTYFAEQARKEGLAYIAMVFEEIANQEKEHAKRFFSFLEGGNVEIQATFPAGRVGFTLDNLQAAACGEHEEYSNLYPEFARIAAEEGFLAISKVFEFISVAEKNHEERYRDLIIKLKNDFFKCESLITWYCLNCGYTHEGKEAPKACPACACGQYVFAALG